MYGFVKLLRWANKTKPEPPEWVKWHSFMNRQPYYHYTPLEMEIKKREDWPEYNAIQEKAGKPSLEYLKRKSKKENELYQKRLRENEEPNDPKDKFGNSLPF